MKGRTVTVEIPSRQWTLVIGYSTPGKEGGKYTVGVNGVEMSALPEAPCTAASVDEFCKSSETKKYSETIKSVVHFFIIIISLVSSPGNPCLSCLILLYYLFDQGTQLRVLRERGKVRADCPTPCQELDSRHHPQQGQLQ